MAKKLTNNWFLKFGPLVLKLSFLIFFDKER